MLYGREAEITRIEALIGAARDGHGGTLLLQGEAGIGKTALLEEASRHATGMRQLTTAGLEAESSLPFSALAELTERLLDGISALPEPQAAAIKGALAIEPSTPGDRFAVCAGFVGLLARAAEDEPMLVIVDDAHWLDHASAECLAFAGRRLGDTPIALLVATRSQDPMWFPGPGVDRVALSGLKREAAQELLSDSDSELGGQVAAYLLDAAAGNPLALIELPPLLTAEQRRGSAPLEEPLLPGVSLQRAFEERVGRLPTPTQDALLVAATAFTPSLQPIAAACRTLGAGPEAFEPAEADGLVRLTAERVAFAHPLLRGAVYHAASPSGRRRAHEALAEDTEEEHRAWHLAAAALGPDERAAAALEQAAQRATSRGAHAPAAEALERAAGLSEHRDARARRLIAAGSAATAGGAHARAAAVLEEAAQSDDPELRGEANHLLAMVTLWETGDSQSAYRLLVEEADRVEAEDPLRAATLLADAGIAATSAGDNHLTLATARRARELLGELGDATQRAQVLSVLGWSLALRGESDAARPVLEEVDRLLPAVDPFSPAAQSIGVALNSRIPSEEYERSREECVAIVAGAREAGFLGMVPFPMVVGADAAHRLGDWDAADREAEEAFRLAWEIGQRGSLPIALVIRAWVAAGRGDEKGARGAASRALEIAEPAGMGSTVVYIQAALGLLELGLGRIDKAIDELEAVERAAHEQGLDEPTLIPWAPDLVEAYLQTGRRTDADRVTSKLEGQAERAGGTLARAMAHRCRGLVTAEGFEPSFTSALELHERVPVPFEQARTRFAFGTRLHRARRRAEARERLREALETFEQLEATPWAERASAELHAAGAIKRAPVGDPDELTAQEVRVALAVARGATNREVAAELFLSPKTIEYHLGHVYRKFGIHSRTELAALAADGRLEPATAPPSAAR